MSYDIILFVKKMSVQATSSVSDNEQSIAKKLAIKYPDKIPVIVNHVQNRLNRTKYIVPKDITMSEFMIHVRKMNHRLNSGEALFFFINETLVNMSMQMHEIYTKYKFEDGFVYITCATESTFG